MSILSKHSAGLAMLVFVLLVGQRRHLHPLGLEPFFCCHLADRSLCRGLNRIEPHRLKNPPMAARQRHALASVAAPAFCWWAAIPLPILKPWRTASPQACSQHCWARNRF
jgi:hypothetical protein